MALFTVFKSRMPKPHTPWSAHFLPINKAIEPPYHFLPKRMDLKASIFNLTQEGRE